MASSALSSSSSCVPRALKSVVVPRSKTHDLRLQTEALRLFTDSKPDIFIHLAAVVGGIGANRENPWPLFLRQRHYGYECH